MIGPDRKSVGVAGQESVYHVSDCAGMHATLLLKSCAISEGLLATLSLPHSFCWGDKNLIILCDIKKKDLQLRLR